MAQLQRHPSLRFSVFELATDLGLESHAFDGNFDAIIEEDEPRVRTFPRTSPTEMLTTDGSLQPSPGKQQRRTHSSDELTDPPYPLTPPSSNVVRSHSSLNEKTDVDHAGLTMVFFILFYFSLSGSLLPAATNAERQKIR